MDTEKSAKLELQVSILLIESQAFSRFLIRHELEKHGFIVRTARSKLEAADLLAGSTAPDFLILGDMSENRIGPYRIICLPNSRARLKGAQLAGHKQVPQLPRPLTAVDLAEKVEQLIELRKRPHLWRHLSEVLDFKQLDEAA